MGQAKLTQKLSGGKAASIRDNNFGAFVEAVNDYGAAFLVSQSGGRDSSELIQPEHAKKLDFKAPSYDFGKSFLNAPQPFRVALQDASFARLDGGELHLPHERCFFLFSFLGQRHDTVVEAVEGSDKITIRAWYRSANTRWIEQSADLAINRLDGSAEFQSDFDGSRGRVQLLRTLGGLVCAASMLLATRPEDDIIERTELPVSGVRAAAAPGKGVVHPTRLIRIRTTASTRFDWNRVKPVNPLSQCGSPRSPHDRRGHERVYKKTGLRIWINETKIKGGSQKPRPAVVQVLH